MPIITTTLLFLSLIFSKISLASLDDVSRKMSEQFAAKSSLVGDFLANSRYQEAIWLLNALDEKSSALEIKNALYNYMQTGEIVRIEPLGGGSTPTQKVIFANGISGVFKAKVTFKKNGLFLSGYLSTNIRSEASAYIVDQLLELDLVPMTILRQVGAQFGSLQYFVKGAISAENLTAQERVKPAKLLLLDYFIKNIDRSTHNYMYMPSLNKFIAIDNSWSLRNTSMLSKIKSYGVDKRTASEVQRQFPLDQVPSEAEYQRLKNLDPAKIEEELKSILKPEALAKLIARRQKVLASIEEVYRKIGYIPLQ